MKHTALRLLFFFFIALQVVSCSNNPFTYPSVFTDESTSPYPSREIFVLEGDLDKPYTTLGPIDYTLRNDFSFFSGQEGLHSEAVTYLKQAALARYGNKVDAIINLEFQDSTEEGFFSPSITYVRGIAVAIKSESESFNKPKRKYKAKSHKKYPSKTKSTNNVIHKPKSKAAEPEITPEEMLK